MTSGGGNDVSASVNRKDQSVIGSEKLYREATISNGEGSLNFGRVKVQIAEVFRVMVLTSDAPTLKNQDHNKQINIQIDVTVNTCNTSSYEVRI